jgi:hypothetical protein
MFIFEARGFFDYVIVEIVDLDVTSSFDLVRNGTTSFSGTI